MAGTSGSFFIQTRAGDRIAGAPRLGGGVDVYSMAAAGGGWDGPSTPFGSEVDADGVALVERDDAGLEMVVLVGGRLLRYSRAPGARWHGFEALPGDQPATAGPALIQSTIAGAAGLEVVAAVDGGLAHWHGDGQDGGWSAPEVIAEGAFGAVSLVQSTHDGGRLEVIALEDDHLVHLSRDAESLTWNRVEVPPASGISGGPGFLQGQRGDFEVVAPLAAGGLGHFRSANDGGEVWEGPTAFGEGEALAAALIEDAAGGLEVVALGPDGSLTRYTRGAADGAWSRADVARPPACDPATGGLAEPPITIDMVGIHAAVLRTGSVLYFAFMEMEDGSLMGVSRVFDPATGTVTEPAGGGMQFCSGHAFLPDGTLLVAAGHSDEDARSIHLFDPIEEAWTQQPDMPRGRWYPTCTALPDGRVLIISGSLVVGSEATEDINNSLALYDPAVEVPAQRLTPEIPLPSPWSGSDSFADFPTIDMYPFVFLLPSGQLLVHCRDTSRTYDVETDTWGPEIRAVYPHSRTYPGEGSGVLLPLSPADGYRPRILVLGGGGADPGTQLDEDTPATPTAEILDMGADSPAWRSTASMHQGAVLVDAVLLPDGRVLAVGGSATGRANQAVRLLLTTELFDPASETWTRLCPVRVPRGYHGTAILLPDGRVALAGKDGLYQADIMLYPERRIEIFSPPYLFAGQRPVITDLPDEITYRDEFTIGTPQAGDVDRVVLMRPGSVTHQVNMEQRLVVLEHARESDAAVRAIAPPGPTVAPPGSYLCFLLGAGGVPSVAGFTRLG